MLGARPPNLLWFCFMHNVHWLFAGNVFAHLVASMSGLASFGIAVYEALKGKKFEGWAFFTVGAICLIVAFDQAWQDEHRNAEVVIAQRASAEAGQNFWKDQSYMKDEAIRVRDGLLAQNFSTLSGTERSLSDLSNKVLDVTKPEKLKITPFFLGQITENAQPGKFSGDWIVITNRSVSPVHMAVKCEHGYTAIGARILGVGAQSGGGTGDIGIDSPPWTPSNPLLVTIYSDKKDVGLCRFDPL